MVKRPSVRLSVRLSVCSNVNISYKLLLLPQFSKDFGSVYFVRKPRLRVIYLLQRLF